MKNISYQEAAKVGYVLGLLSDKLPEKYDEWDECEVLIEQIVLDWQNHVDIQNSGEEGYIQEYAERIISGLIKED